MDRPTLHHIPVCPFSQRLEILLALKGHPEAVRFHVVDITKPRDPDLLRRTRGSTSLPVLELPDGRLLNESLVILTYLDEAIPNPVRRPDPYEHAVERMLIAKEGALITAGYSFVMNQDPDRRRDHLDQTLAAFADLDGFLRDHAPKGPFLFETFGLAEAVFTPVFMRLWFLDYYEGFDLPRDGGYDRVRLWREACLAHPSAQQVTREEIVKSYYDYALGAGNGALPPGRTRSSFAFEPHWSERPLPPEGKHGPQATDEQLGLI